MGLNEWFIVMEHVEISTKTCLNRMECIDEAVGLDNDWVSVPHTAEQSRAASRLLTSLHDIFDILDWSLVIYNNQTTITLNFIATADWLEMQF